MDNEGIENTAEELKGKAKETLGDLTDNELESEGAAEEAHAKAKQDVEDAAEDLAGRIRDRSQDRSARRRSLTSSAQVRRAGRPAG